MYAANLCHHYVILYWKTLTYIVQKQYRGIYMKRFAWLVILALTAVMLTAPATAESIKVYVSESTLKCYSAASSSSKQVATLGYGESVSCIALNGDWAQVQAENGATAFCRIGGLTTSDPNTGSLTAYVVSGGANAYSRPGTSYKSAALEGGMKLTVVALTPDKSWCRVKKSGSYAYMRVSDLTTEKPDTSAAANPVTAYAVDNIVKIYSAASKSASCVAVAGYGEKLSCTAVDGGWAKVKYGGVTGWCYASKLATSEPDTASVTVYAASDTKAYALPDKSAAALCTLSSGASLKCVAITPDGDWLRVTASGKYGYVPAEAMTTAKPGKVDALINLAMAQLGKPYAYATRGPGSFDCSGFTLYCFREVANISLGRSAQSQGYNEKYPKITSVSELKRGDIVCFDTESGDSDLTDHVGIYLGDGKFIHASSAKGEVVISSLSSGYYRRTFTWARRLIG